MAAVAAGALILATGGPASSQVPDPTVGAGAGTGWEYGTSGDPCGVPIAGGVVITDESFELSHYGTIVAAPAVGLVPAAVYLGPTDMSITVEDNIAGPLAAYSGDCDSSSFPLPGQIVITSVTITGEAGGGSVSCSGASGTYTRVSSAVAFTFTVDCTTITTHLGLSTTTASQVTFVVAGTMNPCVLVPPLGFPTNPECDVIEDPAAGGAGSHLVTTYTAVAVSPLP